MYKAGRKQFSKQMSFFFALRSGQAAERALDSTTPRVGLTVGKVMGKAVDRNRIKRRMRAAVRANLPLLRLPVDVILHPRRTVMEADFAGLTNEVAQVFRQVQRAAEKQQAPAAPDKAGDR